MCKSVLSDFIFIFYVVLTFSLIDSSAWTNVIEQYESKDTNDLNNNSKTCVNQTIQETNVPKISYFAGKTATVPSKYIGTLVRNSSLNLMKLFTQKTLLIFHFKSFITISNLLDPY